MARQRKSGDEIYQRIRSDILRMHLRPGDYVDENGLAERYGISRTPIREALIRLSADGLVYFGEKRGARVTFLLLPDLPRYMEALDLNRRTACRLAACRRHEPEIELIENALDEFKRAGTLEGVGNDEMSTQVADAEMGFYMQISDAGHNAYMTDSYSKMMVVGLRMMRLPFAYSPRGGLTVTEYLDRVFDVQQRLTESIIQKDPEKAERHAVTLHSMLVKRLREFSEENLLSDISMAVKFETANQIDEL